MVGKDAYFSSYNPILTLPHNFFWFFAKEFMAPNSMILIPWLKSHHEISSDISTTSSPLLGHEQEHLVDVWFHQLLI